MESYIELPRGTDPAEALTQFPGYTHAAHMMLYSRQPGQLFGKYQYKAVAMVGTSIVPCTTCTVLYYGTLARAGVLDRC